MYLVLGPMSVGLKASPCGVNLAGFNLLCIHNVGVSHGIKIRPLDLQVVPDVSICTCALCLLYSTASIGAFL